MMLCVVKINSFRARLQTFSFELFQPENIILVLACSESVEATPEYLYLCTLKACSTRRYLLKSTTMRESNHGSGVCKEHYAYYYICTKMLIFVSRTTLICKISSVACGFSSIKLDHSKFNQQNK